MSCGVRFEKRARECSSVARITANTGIRRETDVPAGNEGRRVKVREVTGL